MMPLSLCLLAMQGKYILFLSSYFPLPMRGRNEKISEKYGRAQKKDIPL